MNTELQQVDDFVDGFSSEYKQTIAKHDYFYLVADSQMQAAKKQLMKQEFTMKIAMSNPESVREALMTAAVLGVDLTEGKRQGWLIPRRNKESKQWGIVFQIGYKGLEAVGQNLGIIKTLSVRIVREGDTFEWSGDDQEKPNHNCNWFDQNRTKKSIIGAFAVTYYPDDTINVVTSTIDHIYTKHRDMSESWKNAEKRQYSPWARFPEAMIEKTMAIIASKSWPAAKMSTPESSPILETLHNNEVADYSLEPPQKKDDRFMGFFLGGDALGLRLLEMEYMSFGVDSEKAKKWIDFYNQFPKGYVTKNKEKLVDLCNTGQLILDEIEDAIASEDDLKLKENISDDRECKKLLAEYLGKEKSEAIKKMLKNSSD